MASWDAEISYHAQYAVTIRRRAHVARDDIMEQLFDAMKRHQVISIEAPSGYGKTVIIAKLAQKLVEKYPRQNVVETSRIATTNSTVVSPVNTTTAAGPPSSPLPHVSTSQTRNTLVLDGEVAVGAEVVGTDAACCIFPRIFTSSSSSSSSKPAGNKSSNQSRSTNSASPSSNKFTASQAVSTPATSNMITQPPTVGSVSPTPSLLSSVISSVTSAITPVVIYRFCGISRRSKSIRNLLLSIVHQIHGHFKLATPNQVEISLSPKNTKADIHYLINLIGKYLFQYPVILLLDGLDRLVCPIFYHSICECIHALCLTANTQPWHKHSMCIFSNAASTSHQLTQMGGIDDTKIGSIVIPALNKAESELLLRRTMLLSSSAAPTASDRLKRYFDDDPNKFIGKEYSNEEENEQKLHNKIDKLWSYLQRRIHRQPIPLYIVLIGTLMNLRLWSGNEDIDDQEDDEDEGEASQWAKSQHASPYLYWQIPQVREWIRMGGSHSHNRNRADTNTTTDYPSIENNITSRYGGELPSSSQLFSTMTSASMLCLLTSSSTSFASQQTLYIAKGIQQVAEQILSLLEAKFDIAIVQNALSFLSLSRQGLTQREIVDLLCLQYDIQVTYLIPPDHPALLQAVDEEEKAALQATIIEGRQAVEEVVAQLFQALAGIPWIMTQCETGLYQNSHSILAKALQQRYNPTLNAELKVKEEEEEEYIDPHVTTLHLCMARYFGNLLTSQERDMFGLAPQPLFFSPYTSLLTYNTNTSSEILAVRRPSAKHNALRRTEQTQDRYRVWMSKDYTNNIINNTKSNNLEVNDRRMIDVISHTTLSLPLLAKDDVASLISDVCHISYLYTHYVNHSLDTLYLQFKRLYKALSIHMQDQPSLEQTLLEQCCRWLQYNLAALTYSFESGNRQELKNNINNMASIRQYITNTAHFLWRLTHHTVGADLLLIQWQELLSSCSSGLNKDMQWLWQNEHIYETLFSLSVVSSNPSAARDNSHSVSSLGLSKSSSDNSQIDLTAIVAYRSGHFDAANSDYSTSNCPKTSTFVFSGSDKVLLLPSESQPSHIIRYEAGDDNEFVDEDDIIGASAHNSIHSQNKYFGRLHLLALDTGLLSKTFAPFPSNQNSNNSAPCSQKAKVYQLYSSTDGCFAANLCSVYNTFVIHTWDTETGVNCLTVPVPILESSVSSARVYFSAKKKMYVSYPSSQSSSLEVAIWDMKTFKLLRTFPLTSSFVSSKGRRRDMSTTNKSEELSLGTEAAKIDDQSDANKSETSSVATFKSSYSSHSKSDSPSAAVVESTTSKSTDTRITNAVKTDKMFVVLRVVSSEDDSRCAFLLGPIGLSTFYMPFENSTMNILQADNSTSELEEAVIQVYDTTTQALLSCIPVSSLLQSQIQTESIVKVVDLQFNSTSDSFCAVTTISTLSTDDTNTAEVTELLVWDLDAHSRLSRASKFTDSKDTTSSEIAPNYSNNTSNSAKELADGEKEKEGFLSTVKRRVSFFSSRGTSTTTIINPGSSSSSSSSVKNASTVNKKSSSLLGRVVLSKFEILAWASLHKNNEVSNEKGLVLVTITTNANNNQFDNNVHANNFHAKVYDILSPNNGISAVETGSTRSQRLFSATSPAAAAVSVAISMCRCIAEVRFQSGQRLHSLQTVQYHNYSATPTLTVVWQKVDDKSSPNKSSAENTRNIASTTMTSISSIVTISTISLLSTANQEQNSNADSTNSAAELSDPYDLLMQSQRQHLPPILHFSREHNNTNTNINSLVTSNSIINNTINNSQNYNSEQRYLMTRHALYDTATHSTLWLLQDVLQTPSSTYNTTTTSNSNDITRSSSFFNRESISSVNPSANPTVANPRTSFSLSLTSPAEPIHKSYNNTNHYDNNDNNNNNSDDNHEYKYVVQSLCFAGDNRHVFVVCAKEDVQGITQGELVIINTGCPENNSINTANNVNNTESRIDNNNKSNNTTNNSIIDTNNTNYTNNIVTNNSAVYQPTVVQRYTCAEQDEVYFWPKRHRRVVWVHYSHNHSTNDANITTRNSTTAANSNCNSSNNDGRVEIYDAWTGQLLLRGPKHHAQVIAKVSFSLNGDIGASADYDATVKIWTTVTGEVLFTLNQALHSFQFLLFWDQYITTNNFNTSNNSNTNLNTNKMKRFLLTPYDAAREIKHDTTNNSHNGNNNNDKGFHIWDLETGFCVQKFGLPHHHVHAFQLYTSCISNNSTNMSRDWFVYQAWKDDDHLYLFDLVSKSILCTLTLPAAISSFAIAIDTGKIVAVLKETSHAINTNHVFVNFSSNTFYNIREESAAQIVHQHNTYNYSNSNDNGERIIEFWLLPAQL